MRTKNYKTILLSAVRAGSLLLCAAAAAYGQVNLAAGPATATLPDGATVPMWGYSCGVAVTGSTATCAPLNKTAAAAGGWSPVVITAPTGGSLQINLTNNLTFTGASIPTSLTIVGQLGGGLGTSRTTAPSPTHASQGVTWAVVASTPAFTPPSQGARVQSLATEVAPGATTSLTWNNLRAGTYLIESGTHPSIQGPMGLYGILVVTAAPTATAAGLAYPGVNYGAEVPLLLSEIDPVQNKSVSTAVNTSGFSEANVWSGQPTGCGNPASSTFNTCYPPAVNYTPLYYMVNGAAFNKTNPTPSLAVATTGAATGTVTGNVLLRVVNAGLHMHVPSVVGSVTTQTVLAGTTTPSGFSIIAEDGNPAPGIPHVQSDVFMAPGKTFDLMINPPTTALPFFDRELSLAGNAINRDGGMLAYISVNGAALPAGAAAVAAKANPDTYNSVIAGQTLSVMDPAKGVLANDINVFGAQIQGTAPAGLTLYPNGTFTYTGGVATSFTYCGNGATSGAACASVTLGGGNTTSTITCTSTSFASTMATYLAVKTPGVLAGCTDSLGFPVTVDTTSVTGSGVTVLADANGGFTATTTAAGTPSFTFKAKNSQGVESAAVTVNLTFPTGSGLKVSVVDGSTKAAITDYRWVIEEDRTFYIDPTKTTNTGTTVVPTLGVNFHTSYMPFVAQGCTGLVSCEAGQTVLGVPSVCDVSNGVCRPGTQKTAVDPSQVHLDPTKRYYISVLPGDAADPFEGKAIGHGMGGAPIGIDPNTGVQASSVTVLSQASPYPTADLSVFVFEDDFPLNGEQDGGGGIDVLSPNEPGLGGFQIHLWDAMGGNGDFTGQMTYDMFNQPLSNGLDGMTDPATGQNACPITKAAAGITGMIVTCPKYEGDGVTLSPLSGQAVVKNLMPGRWGVIATPGADRIARGEEWLQTNTLDGQKAHDAFTRIGEPSYFQEFGPASFHVSVGFANPAIINARHAGVCAGIDANLPPTPPATTMACNNTLTGKVTGEHLSRTPDERLYSTTSHDTYYWTQCYVSFGDPDGEDFAFTKCNADGTFTLTGLPDGDWRVTTFDQWNDMLVDGLSTPIRLSAGSAAKTTPMGDIASTQWQTNLYTKTFVDDAGSGVAASDSTGIPFLNVAVRLRDGSLENLLLTDFTGTANFNESFPLFSWYTVETDVTRYKNTGIHAVYDVGGPVDGTLSTCGGSINGAGYPPCGTSTIAKFLANTVEQVSVPSQLRVPGSVYCANADCSGYSIANGPLSSALSNCSLTGASVSCSATPTLSSGRIDPPWVGVEGWQGFPGQNNFLEFGKKPYVAGENGGIHGHVIYASTRPFDDPMMLVQTQWTPLVPHVTINLYQEGVAADNVTPTRKLVDTTQTSSFDDFAQGFRSDGYPNMNCPGQGGTAGPLADLFYFSLFNQPNYLDVYNNVLHGTATSPTALPANSQFKCYDGMHNWNQLQPVPYDGAYAFPSVTGRNPVTGNTTGTNCTICVKNPDSADAFRFGKEDMLPAGKYVVEVVVPPGFELVKEEDKNILIGDNYIAPVLQQFGGLGNVFILPDQANVASAWSAGYNVNNAQNSTNSLGTSPNNSIVPGFVPEPTWPCVGEVRIVPDYISLFPQSAQVSPFAGASRPLCDRKEVTLADQMGAIAKFYVYTSTHIASKFTGGITDDYTSEFDPFSPQFGEKFAPPDLPVSIKDWTGAEISRVYADHWGAYDGMTYSTWEVNPPNPTGYAPTMMVFCMNDPGPIMDTRSGSLTKGQMITDPAFAQGYSQFCYELPFMPGTTQYLDTPVVPTSAFAGAGYNNVDCAYPTNTPAVSEVDGDGVGPYVSKAGNKIVIKSLGDQTVPNYGYSGPSATVAPYNARTISRHYGFGAAPGTVTIGGVPATVASGGWSDTQITVTVPTGVPNCAIQQQAQYGGSTAQCGQLVITAASGQQSVDAVTITIGGKAPTYVSGTSPTPLTQYGTGSIQQAIDAASPGDLIMVSPGTYNEMILMWKPVRLQGVGAATTIINANTHPAGKLDPWRRQVNCLFGLALDGTPNTYGAATSNPFDPTSTFTCGSSNGVSWNQFNGAVNNPQVDRLALEATVGWDATLNGNLAELLQEPTLMGALEGAAITVLSKGVDFHGQNPFAADTFPTGTTLLIDGPGGNSHCHDSINPYPSNFECNPSSIDGLGITNSSQGGGAIFVHAWGHNLQIANNRIYDNSGTLSGGINVGQGEFPPGYIQGSATNAAPGSCQASSTTNVQLPYCHNLNVNVHNNYISLNSSTGDELFSATPAGAGGVSFCTGSDFYKFNYNWLCGNLSSGDGGGVGQLGFSYNGDIEHNSVIFNQSLNPTIPANGGGILIMGAPDVDPVCGATTDADCVDNPITVGPSDGMGPGLVINANLIMGNAAEAGSGGGLRFQNVNGSEVVAFPTTPKQWYSATVTNNIIVDNVAGWDGAGISLMDALNVNIFNNTIASNSTTATAGVLFNTIGAPLASAGGPTCTVNCGTKSAPQPAGLVSIQNSAVLSANLPASVKCPANHYAGTGDGTNGTCRSQSYPWMSNNVFWQNSAYYIGVGALTPAFQQNVVTLYNAGTNTPAPNQTATGQCVAASYWDIGVRGDSGPTDHSGGTQLNPQSSILTSTAGYPTAISAANPNFVSQYCDGSRQPPELGTSGWAVPPGISDATVPNPVFSLTPVATVDEGNNWINLRWGPLSMLNPASSNATTNVVLGNYALAAGSPAIDAIASSSTTFPTGTIPTLTTDFFGHPRPDSANPTHFDVGAVEFQGTSTVAVASVTGGPLTFTSQVIGTTSAAQTLTLHNTGTATLTGIGLTFTGPFSRPGGTCGATLAAGANCSINVVFTPTAGGAATGTLAIAASVTVTGSPVGLSGTGVVAVTSATLTPTSHAYAAQTRSGTACGTADLGCLTAPLQVFTLTNTGNVTLTGIAQGVLGGTNPVDFNVDRLVSTCGPGGGGQALGQVTLAPGASCVITVAFHPRTSDTAGAKAATISVSDSAGTQTSTLTGTAN
jgi:hypothetical protein